MIIQPNLIDYKKFKRIFAFGCSFTLDKWPTWADILRQEMPLAEFYNFGRSGAGNLMISCQIMEASKKFNFNQDDLILVMWTTFCREDRWINGSWLHPGNIYTQNIYEESFVKKFSDPTGYLIRDLAIISFSLNYLDSLRSTGIAMPSVPISNQMDTESHIFKDITNLYNSMYSSMPGSLMDVEMQGIWENGHAYYSNHYKQVFNDYHPNPLRYFGYLKKIGFPLSNSAEEYAIKVTKDLHSTKTEDELSKMFEDLAKYDSRNKLF